MLYNIDSMDKGDFNMGVRIETSKGFELDLSLTKLYSSPTVDDNAINSYKISAGIIKTHGVIFKKADITRVGYAIANFRRPCKLEIVKNNYSACKECDNIDISKVKGIPSTYLTLIRTDFRYGGLGIGSAMLDFLKYLSAKDSRECYEKIDKNEVQYSNFNFKNSDNYDRHYIYGLFCPWNCSDPTETSSEVVSKTESFYRKNGFLFTNKIAGGDLFYTGSIKETLNSENSELYKQIYDEMIIE